jgi:ribosomal protein S27AE
VELNHCANFKQKIINSQKVLLGLAESKIPEDENQVQIKIECDAKDEKSLLEITEYEISEFMPDPEVSPVAPQKLMRIRKKTGLQQTDYSFLDQKTHDEVIYQNQNLKSFSCDKCGKMFQQKGTLSEHLNLELERKNYSCQNCGKLMASNGARISCIKKLI